MSMREDTRILLVEDNYINQRVVMLIFKQLGFKCDLASNGQVAYEMFRQLPYDLVFMDIQMPVLDGLESAKKIRSFEKEKGIVHSTIIALTANETSEFGGKYIEAGMDGAIEKPLKVDQIRNYLSQMKNSGAFHE